MIKLVTPEDVERFVLYCNGDPFGCKLYSLIKAYGTQEMFADFWLSLDDNDEINAVIGRLESIVTVCAKGEVNEEVELFVQMLPSVSCIELPTEGDMLIMRARSDNQADMENVRIDDGIYSIYKLLCAESDDFSNAEAGAVYVDIHRRIRCGVMKTALVRTDENEPCACAIASLSQDSALISSVMCLEKHRHKGYATKAVKALLSQLDRENVFLFCEPKMESFYKKLGFEKSGSFQMVTRL